MITYEELFKTQTTQEEGLYMPCIKNPVKIEVGEIPKEFINQFAWIIRTVDQQTLKKLYIRIGHFLAEETKLSWR